jgi:hypothetical protein
VKLHINREIIIIIIFDVDVKLHIDREICVREEKRRMYITSALALPKKQNEKEQT